MNHLLFVECLFGNQLQSSRIKHQLYTLTTNSSPDEYPFTKSLPDPVLPPLNYPSILHKNSVKVNDEILKVYMNDIVPSICKKGTDGNFGSSATKDFEVLQIMSRRIHFGMHIS